MQVDRTFRFLDEQLQNRLQAALDEAAVPYCSDDAGAIAYSSADEEVVDDVISDIRHSVFSEWALLSCPADWIQRYRDYMATRQIPFVEEMNDGEVWFLVSSHVDTDQWEKSFWSV